MARTVAIIYGALRVGDTPTNARIKLTDKSSYETNRDTVTWTWRVFIESATAAQLITDENQLVDAMRTPDQKLEILLAGGSRKVYDPATNSGFLTRGSCRRLGSAADTDKSAEFECSVTAQLPANLPAGRDGRREIKVRVEQNASERVTASFSGTFTAITGLAARQNYLAEIVPFVDTELAALGGTWNPTVNRSYEYDAENKIVSFVEQYEQILHAESQGGTDLSSVVLQQLRVRRSKFGDRRSTRFGEARPWELVLIEYAAAIRKSVTTDLQGLWDGTLRSHVLAQVDALIVMREEVNLDKAENRISATIVARASRTGLIESRVTVERNDNLGKALVPSWDGNPYSRWRYQDIASDVAVVLVQFAATEGGLTIGPREAIPDYLRDASKWDEVSRGRTEDDFTIGAEGSPTEQKVIGRSHLYVFVRAETPETGGAEDEPESDRPITQPGPGGASDERPGNFGDDF